MDRLPRASLSAPYFSSDSCRDRATTTDPRRQISLPPHYRRAAQEGRTLIQSALANTADLTLSDCEFGVRLHPLSSPHRTRAIAALCDELNRSPVFFPGSSLRLHFSVATSAKKRTF